MVDFVGTHDRISLMKMADRLCLRMESQLRRWPRLKNCLFKDSGLQLLRRMGRRVLKSWPRKRRCLRIFLGKCWGVILGSALQPHPWFKMELRVRGEVTFPDWRWMFWHGTVIMKDSKFKGFKAVGMFRSFTFLRLFSSLAVDSNHTGLVLIPPSPFRPFKIVAAF